MSRWRTTAVILALALVANAAYAWTLPEFLASFNPAMPHGFQETSSPTIESPITFVDRTADTGISFLRQPWLAGQDLPYPAVIGGAVAAGDINGDGWVDLYFPPGGPGLEAKLYQNLGNWSFRDITADIGLAIDGFGTGAAFGDFDNDGDSDLYVTIDGLGRLYENRAGNFSEVPGAAGASLLGACGRPCQPSSVTWLDHDRDGDLDLYVVNNLDWRAPGLHTSGQDYASLIYFAARQESVLLRNDGGAFTDITAQAGVPNTGKGLGVVAADINGDGWGDLATANDITENALYINQADGTFRNEARSRGANEVKTAMGIVVGDVDGDGRPDLVVSNFKGHKLSLLLQKESGAFSYSTDSRGLGVSWQGTGWGVAVADFDLDGWLDIAHAVGRPVPLEPHRNDLHNLVFPDLREDAADQFFLNLGGRFADATATAGDLAGHSNTRAILAVDLDNDGDEDLVRVNVNGQPAELLENRGAPGRSIQLVLAGSESNRDGIGAVVTATLPDGRILVRERLSAAGFQTGLSPVLTIGIGDSESAMVQISWPSGRIQDLGNLSAGIHRITESP